MHTKMDEILSHIFQNKKMLFQNGARSVQESLAQLPNILDPFFGLIVLSCFCAQCVVFQIFMEGLRRAGEHFFLLSDEIGSRMKFGR